MKAKVNLFVWYSPKKQCKKREKFIAYHDSAWYPAVLSNFILAGVYFGTREAIRRAWAKLKAETFESKASFKNRAQNHYFQLTTHKK